MSSDLIAWAASEGRRLDADLEALADRRLALHELERAALQIAAERRTIGCTFEALMAAHRDDPAAMAGVRSLIARAIDHDAQNESNPTEQEEHSSADDWYAHDEARERAE